MPNSVVKNGTFSVLLCTGWGLSECSKRQKMRENIELENIFEALPFFFFKFQKHLHLMDLSNDFSSSF